jgi:hypothetical protein
VPFRLRYRPIPDLPRLAWLATADLASGAVEVAHGPAVECRDAWMVEGVWDGEFTQGAFDGSDHFFGSGLRLEEDRLSFVASTGLGDRLLWTAHSGRVLVSNSLPLLLTATGARLDPRHDYRAETFAIRQGAVQYPDTFVVDHPEIRTFHQVYDSCLALEPSGRTERIGRRRAPRFRSYAEYRALLGDVLRRLRTNYTSGARHAPMPAFVTVSSGYDSVATAALVAELGVTAAFTCRRSNSHLPAWLAARAAIDDGSEIARALGLPLLPPQDAAAATVDERYFLAAGCMPPTLALRPLASCVARGESAAVVFTGFGGDEVWDTQAEREYHERGIVRGDAAGLGLSEMRLQSGFINVPVPTLCSRHIADLDAVAAHEEMDPWRLLTAYDRPIARRIAETAGVAGRSFGQTKKAVIAVYPYPVTRRLRPSFFAYVRRTLGVGPVFVRFHAALNRFVFPFVRAWHVIRRALLGGERVLAPRTPHAHLWPQYDFPYAMFLWAVETLSAELGATLHRPLGAPGLAVDEAVAATAKRS